MTSPVISVVMGVFNDAEALDKTVQSILSQSGVELEFIIVNDGSTDQSFEILKKIEQVNESVLIIDQDNQGLTKALINGCAVARGKYIARQDNGDLSYPGRLRTQLEYLESHTGVSMLSCATKFVAPDGEELYTVIQSADDAEHGLRGDSPRNFKGPPHHGSVMFRKDDYSKVGGYRSPFKVAQDIDLWSRLVEIGHHHSLSDVYYQAIVAKNSISMLKRDSQLDATQAVIDCSLARKKTGNDTYILTKYLASENTNRAQGSKRHSDAAYYYFLGSNLSKPNPVASSKYLRLATKSNPFHWKAWVKRAINRVRRIFNGTLK